MRPGIRFLGDQLIEKIIAEARDLLLNIGMEIHNPGVLSMLADFGAKVELDTHHACFTNDIIDEISTNDC